MSAEPGMAMHADDISVIYFMAGAVLACWTPDRSPDALTKLIKKTTRLDIRTHCGPIFGLVENSIEERGLGRGDIFQVRLQANIGNLNANGKNIFHNHIPVYKRFRSPAKIPIINLAAKFYKYQNYFSVHLQIALRTRFKAIPPSILKYSVLRANLVNLEKSQKYSKMHIG